MPSEKRQRQRENQMRDAVKQEQTDQRGRRTKLILRLVGIAVVLVVAAFLYSILTDDGDTTIASSNTVTVSPAETSEPGESAEPGESGETGESGESGEATPTTFPEDCPAEDGSSPKTVRFTTAPAICIDANQLYAADFVTSMGDFTLVLDPALDLLSVNNFIVLSRFGAYEGTTFHRVISQFVIQGGDVEGNLGTGSPGYRFTGGYPPEGWYRVGAAAMANSGDASSNGSQFFIVSGSSGVNLPPNYSPLGLVTQGLDVVAAIDAVPTEQRTRLTGQPADDVPVEDVVVTSVTIRNASEADVAAYTAS